MEYEPFSRFWAFVCKIGSGSASKGKVGSWSASKWPDPHRSDNQDPDPHHSDKQNPDPHQSGNQDPDPHQSDYQDRDQHRSDKKDPDPHQGAADPQHWFALSGLILIDLAVQHHPSCFLAAISIGTADLEDPGLICLKDAPREEVKRRNEPKLRHKARILKDIVLSLIASNKQVGTCLLVYLWSHPPWLR
jgi:hypothetical protein